MEETPELSDRKLLDFWREPGLRDACFSQSCMLKDTDPITFKLGPKLDTESGRGNIRQIILVRVRPYVSDCGRHVEWQPFYRSTGLNSSR